MHIKNELLIFIYENIENFIDFAKEDGVFFINYQLYQ